MSRFGNPLAVIGAAILLFACSSDDDGGASNGGTSSAGTSAGGTSSAGTGGGGTSAGGTSSGGSGGQMEPEVTFTDDIHPILLAKCGTSGCHDGDQEPFLPGHGAEDVQDAYEAATGMSSISGRVYERIVARISSDNPTEVMPPSYANPPCEGGIGRPGCVTEAELALIEEWIAEGTPL